MNSPIEVKPGQWVVARLAAYGVSRFCFISIRADRVTQKLVKSAGPGYGGTTHFSYTPRERVVAVFDDEKAAMALVHNLAGAEGERRRRHTAANEACEAQQRRVIEKATEKGFEP